MFDVVGHIPEDMQKVILRDIQEALKLSPVSRFVLPAGIARRENCTGDCQTCFIHQPGDRHLQVAATNLGQWGWISNRCGYHYIQKHPETGEPFPPIPESVRRVALAVSSRCGYTIDPQSAYINVYQADGRLGLHQDKDEKALHAPVISISLGASAIFLRGGATRRDTTEEIPLKSGDIMLMGGEHRLAFHGVKTIIPAEHNLALKPGCRINITVRQYE